MTILVGLPFRVSDMPTPLTIARSELGQTHQLVYDELNVAVVVPRHENDFLHWVPFVPGEYRTFMDWGQSDEVSLYVVYVIVAIETRLTAAAVNAKVDDALSQAADVWSRAFKVAGAVVASFLTWVRATTRLTSLALSSDEAELVGPSRMVEVDTGEEVMFGGVQGGVAVARDPDGKYHLEPGDFAALLYKIASREQPPTAEILLADAEALARHGRDDAARAVLMAAVACEVKVKANLQSNAGEATRVLIDFILTHPHEVTLTAVDSLFDKLMQAVQSRSLRTADRQLFNDLKELFRVRNAIVHRGQLPDADTARGLVWAARRAFKWLDAPSGTHNFGQSQ